jgi:hypothetical protein
MNDSLQARSLREASNHPLNRRCAELLRQAGETPDPTILQPALQLVQWLSNQPERAKLQSPNPVTLADVAELAHNLSQAEDQVKVLRLLNENPLPESDSPEAIAGHLSLILADQLTNQLEPDSQQ